MKKTMNYLLGGVVVLSSVAISTSISVFSINKKNVNVQNDSILANSNNDVVKNNQKPNQENNELLKENNELLKELSNEVTKLNGISFSNFEINEEDLNSIRNLTQDEVFENLVAKAYNVKNSNSFEYEIVDFRNNLTNKTISFKFRVYNSENKKEYLDTNLYTISWTLDKKGEIINELSFEELESFVNDKRYVFGKNDIDSKFKDIVLNALSNDWKFNLHADYNYYDTSKGKFVAESETKWLDKKSLIKINTKSGIEFTIRKIQESNKKYLYRGEIILFDKYVVDDVKLTGMSLLDTWLTKTVSKKISNDWLWVCLDKNISKTTLEAERLNSIIDRRVAIKDMNIPREMFNSDVLVTRQGDNLVNYGNYFLSSDKGMEKNLFDPAIIQLIMDNLEFSDDFTFDHTQFDYSFTSMRDYKIISGEILVGDKIVEVVNKVIVNTEIQVKSKATHETVKTEKLTFNISVEDRDLFVNSHESMLDRMGLGLIDDGTYSLSYSVNPVTSLIEHLEIPNLDRDAEDKWFFEFWQKQQKDLLREKFGIINPNIENIIYKRSEEISNRINVEILMDKSKGTFEDTFKAVYGVDYKETIQKLRDLGRGTEAAILKNIQKIQVYGFVDEMKSWIYTQHKVNKQTIWRRFFTTSSRIFLDSSEKIGFGAKDRDAQIYQSRVGYKWEYNARR